MRNTAIMTTVLTDRQGAAVRITDFAPRFPSVRPHVPATPALSNYEPVAGLPRITIRVRPTSDYGHPITRHPAGSNHIRFIGEWPSWQPPAPMSRPERGHQRSE